MKRVYIELDIEEKKRFFKILKAEFFEKKIGLEQFPAQCTDAYEEGLIVTDNPETAAWAKQQDIACIAYEPPGSAISIYGADMVVQDLADLDCTFLGLIYRRHHGLPWTIAETERLILRESKPEDFEILYEIYQEAGMADYMEGMEGEKEAERQMFYSYICHMYPFYNYGLWSIVEKASGRVIGRAGLENGMYRGQPVIELGYMIGSGFQNKGYGLEAAQAVVSYGFEAVGAKQIYSFINDKNHRSLQLIVKAGFRERPGDKPGIRAFIMENRD